MERQRDITLTQSPFLFQKFIEFNCLDGENTNLHLFSELKNMLFNEYSILRLLQKNTVHLLWITVGQFGIKLQFLCPEACLKLLFCGTARQTCCYHRMAAITAWLLAKRGTVRGR